MVKTLSFAGVHFTVALTVGYLISGSWAVGGAIAVIEPLCNTVAYFFHEKAWERRQRRAAGQPARSGWRLPRRILPRTLAAATQ